jgi:hypothetical protein
LSERLLVQARQRACKSRLSDGPRAHGGGGAAFSKNSAGRFGFGRCPVLLLLRFFSEKSRQPKPLLLFREHSNLAAGFNSCKQIRMARGCRYRFGWKYGRKVSVHSVEKAKAAAMRQAMLALMTSEERIAFEAQEKEKAKVPIADVSTAFTGPSRHAHSLASSCAL